MSLQLERLVYRSTATGTTESILNLATILAESQRNNDRDGLTGALAAHRESYIQVIEGSAQALDGLMRRLEGDPRHRDIVILQRRTAAGRLFADWSMASARIDPSVEGALDAMMADGAGSAERIVDTLLKAVPGARAAA